uniref:Metallo-beta-lactamase domain-containing protein n=1 Tax=Acrobeloides nanus TaxID=290746 RepID=A0A914CJD1_9BILA
MFSKTFFSTDKKGIPSDPEKLDETLPVLKPDFGLESSLSMTWIGHATCFVNIESIHFVTDPIWSPRASPFKSVGPKRYRPPPCTIEELPVVHFAVISHNHRDHFDIPSIRNLAQRFPTLIWFVPKGLKRDIEPIVGINTVYEMTW